MALGLTQPLTELSK